MKGWDEDPHSDGASLSTPGPSAEALARVRQGRNELYTTVQKGVVVDPAELVDVLRRFVRQIVDEALAARGIR